MTAPASPELPARSWTEGQKLTVQGGGEIQRWGSVKMACKILGAGDKGTIYELIQAKCIVAFKLRPHCPNSHWKVDLLSVWEHKQRQIGG